MTLGSTLDADAIVRPFMSSTTCTYMWATLRNTVSRGRASVAPDALPDAVLDALAAILFRLDAHYFAPVFPTFFFSTSPV